MKKQILQNTPAALAGAFLGALVFYWGFWFYGLLLENRVKITIEATEVLECSQST